MIYIATFYSHFGAMRCKKMCDETGIPARMMPVPRMLSSSCGTCVRMEAEDAGTLPRTEEMEQLAQEQAGCYLILWKAEEDCTSGL
ncbi:MAG: DUF3343 domain-containing protein [Lachnospiraceae bacterium]|nr:DUF3343 domain-containing protein [Lachnospiraceae bacterium]